MLGWAAISPAAEESAGMRTKEGGRQSWQGHGWLRMYFTSTILAYQLNIGRTQWYCRYNCNILLPLRRAKETINTRDRQT